MLEVALLILTLTADGEQRLSVSQTASMAACQSTRATIVGVLKQRQITVQEARCAANNLPLTPYAHGAKADAYQHHYKVTLLANEAYQLTYLKGGELCSASKSKDKTVVFAVASQRPAKP